MYTKFCVQVAFRLSSAVAPGFAQIAALPGGDVSAFWRVPVPLCAKAGGQNPPSPPEPPTRRRGRPPRKGAGRAHTARQPKGARRSAATTGGQPQTRRGKARAGAPRPTACASRARACPPSPAKISARGRPPEGGEPDGGKGGAPSGRGGGRGTRPAPRTPQPSSRRPDAAASASTSARRQAAGATDRAPSSGGKPDTRTRKRAAGSGKPETPDAEQPPAGARAATPSPHDQHGRDHARGGEAAARRPGDGANRAAKGRKAAPPPHRHQRRKAKRQSAQAGQRDDAERTHRRTVRRSWHQSHDRQPLTGSDTAKRRRGWAGGAKSASPEQLGADWARSGGAPPPHQTQQHAAELTAARLTFAKQNHDERRGGRERPA